MINHSTNIYIELIFMLFTFMIHKEKCFFSVSMFNKQIILFRLVRFKVVSVLINYLKNVMKNVIISQITWINKGDLSLIFIKKI
jgi:hypothetical protein